jgi:hypothetical protein
MIDTFRSVVRSCFRLRPPDAGHPVPMMSLILPQLIGS